MFYALHRYYLFIHSFIYLGLFIYNIPLKYITKLISEICDEGMSRINSFLKQKKEKIANTECKCTG